MEHKYFVNQMVYKHLTDLKYVLMKYMAVSIAFCDDTSNEMLNISCSRALSCVSCCVLLCAMPMVVKCDILEQKLRTFFLLARCSLLSTIIKSTNT